MEAYFCAASLCRSVLAFFGPKHRLQWLPQTQSLPARVECYDTLFAPEWRFPSARKRVRMKLFLRFFLPSQRKRHIVEYQVLPRSEHERPVAQVTRNRQPAEVSAGRIRGRLLPPLACRESRHGTDREGFRPPAAHPRLASGVEAGSERARFLVTGEMVLRPRQTRCLSSRLRCSRCWGLVDSSVA